MEAAIIGCDLMFTTWARKDRRIDRLEKSNAEKSARIVRLERIVSKQRLELVDLRYKVTMLEQKFKVANSKSPELLGWEGERYIANLLGATIVGKSHDLTYNGLRIEVKTKARKGSWRLNPEKDYDWIVLIDMLYLPEKLFLLSKQDVLKFGLKNIGYPDVKFRVTTKQLVERINNA